VLSLSDCVSWLRVASTHKFVSKSSTRDIEQNTLLDFRLIFRKVLWSKLLNFLGWHGVLSASEDGLLNDVVKRLKKQGLSGKTYTCVTVIHGVTFLELKGPQRKQHNWPLCLIMLKG
jgi:hypothetical protein